MYIYIYIYVYAYVYVYTYIYTCVHVILSHLRSKAQNVVYSYMTDVPQLAVLHT